MDRSGNEEGYGILKTQTSLLSVRNLSVTFPGDWGEVQAVNSVSLELAPGETLAIVGESGSGKSVTALSILKLIPDTARIETSGILFDGVDLSALDKYEMRTVRGNKIAMIFQEPMSSLNPVLTIGKQVAEPIHLHRKVSWREARQQAVKLLEMVAIPDAEARMDSFPHEFSGGMRQRVMIAMALACQPKLIIADEPTTALDVTVQAQILALLKQLTQENNSSLILITHDLGVVARYADRVAVMYAGRIIETASAAVLYASAKHPYTRGLMASIPGLQGDTRTRLVPIEGQPPDLARLPPGCAFSARCSHASTRCTSAVPELIHHTDTHAWACFGYE